MNSTNSNFEQEIKTIIFDLGGVLINWDPKALYNKIFAGNTELSDWFIEHVCDQEWNMKQDAGRSFSDAIAEKIEQFPKYKDEITAYFERWDETMIGDIPGTVEILKNLYNSKKYTLLSITNWSAETFPKALKRFHFLSYFEDIAVSGELKMIKPYKEIYEYIINKHRINCDKAIFIDDNIENVAASEKLNFKGIHYQNPEQLTNELKNFNIIV